MESMSVLTAALSYIEDNLCLSIKQEDIARECSYSLSSLQKMFSSTFHMGISDYITRRRISAASKELLSTDATVLDIAVKYGYNSHEVFTRAFVRIWDETPSQFRRNRTFSDIFPPFNTNNTVTINEGGTVMVKKTFDISELYDYLKANDGTYVLSFDICGLMPVNDNYGRAAGDKVIAESLKRIDEEKGEDMIMFRIGGDEFVLLTGTSDLETAKAAGMRVIAHNGETVTSGENEIPVSLRFGIMKLESKKNFRYKDLFTKLVEISRPENIPG